MSYSGCLLQCHSAAAVSAHAILVFYCHDLLGEIAFVHVKVEAVHCHQLGESDVVSLSLGVSEMVAEHKYAFFGGMGVEIDVGFEVLVLRSVLCYCFPSCPDCRLLPSGAVVV